MQNSDSEDEIDSPDGPGSSHIPPTIYVIKVSGIQTNYMESELTRKNNWKRGRNPLPPVVTQYISFPSNCLLIQQFHQGTAKEAVEWLIERIEAKNKYGGAELLVRCEPQKQGQVFFYCMTDKSSYSTPGNQRFRHPFTDRKAKSGLKRGWMIGQRGFIRLVKRLVVGV